MKSEDVDTILGTVAIIIGVGAILIYNDIIAGILLIVLGVILVSRLFSFIESLTMENQKNQK